MQRFSSFRDFDWTLLTLLGILSLISVFEIGFLAVGLVLLFLISMVDYHDLIEAVPWLYGLFLGLLLAVHLVGTTVLGAKRWIKLPGGIHFQPSEWMKLVLILSVARFFWSRAGRTPTWIDIGKLLVLVGIPLLMVFKLERDFGTALTYTPILAIGLFLGGIEFRKAAIMVLVFGSLGFVAVRYLHVLKPYQVARLTSFSDPDQDPKGTGYQVRRVVGQGRKSGDTDAG
jgi:rod shape determining protein RodA